MNLSFQILKVSFKISLALVSLTRNRGGIFWIHRKISCLNFEPQYLLNYSSPKNDLYSVRKRSISVFKSIFKLLGWGPASAGPLRAKSGASAAKTLHASCLCLLFCMFQNILRPLWPNVDTSGWKGPETKNGKMENLQLFFFEFFVSFSGFRRHHVKIPWKGAKCYAILSENLIQEFALPYGGQVPLEVRRS